MYFHLSLWNYSIKYHSRKTILTCSAQRTNLIYFKPSFEARSSGFSILVFSKRRTNVTFFFTKSARQGKGANGK